MARRNPDAFSAGGRGNNVHQCASHHGRSPRPSSAANQSATANGAAPARGNERSSGRRADQPDQHRAPEYSGAYRAEPDAGGSASTVVPEFDGFPTTSSFRTAITSGSSR